MEKKEAIKILKDFHDESALFSIRNALETLYPEFKGSRDEKIRKRLIEFFKDWGKTRSHCWSIYIPDILSWLEKQGKSSDQIHYWTEEEIEPIISDYLRGAEHYGGMIARLRCLKPKSLEKQSEFYTKRDVDNAYIEGMASAKRELEKQDEQKPAVEMKTPEESLGIDSDTYNEIVDECIYGEQKSQRMISAEAKEAMYDKPAWSEEDENRLSDAIFFVREYQIPTRDKRLLNAAKEAEEWLKSLKDRVQPQNTWKPSDEQMATLYKYAEQNNYDGSILTSLYNELKKLREE